MKRVSNLVARLRQWGLARTVYFYVMATLRRMFGLQLAYVRITPDRMGGWFDKQYSPPEYETRPVDYDDLAPYADLPGYDLSTDFLTRAFSPGCECAANFYGGELVGYGFITRARAPVTEQLDVVVPHGFRYGYKSWTHQDHRRKNLSGMRAYVRRTEFNRPVAERGIDYVETHNYPSLLHGYQHPADRSIYMGFVGCIRLFGREVPFATRRAKWIGFRWVRKQDDGKIQYV